ncbi:hypothetical protein NDU88_006060 [Pleurodeles waltl]|uniref:Uncharacterized protein n=1 Tax=Pleurodeles waltl TaxID=8319 RepID=A0AAV7ML88_PLEWA|nr:hypothetical protein NDU88_006060 [Pleurodeles waltl]
MTPRPGRAAVSHREESGLPETGHLGGTGRGVGALGQATGPPCGVGPGAIGGGAERVRPGSGAIPPLGKRGAAAGSAGKGARATKEQCVRAQMVRARRYLGLRPKRSWRSRPVDGVEAAGCALGEGGAASLRSGGILVGSPVVTGARAAAKRRSRTLEGTGTRKTGCSREVGAEDAIAGEVARWSLGAVHQDMTVSPCAARGEARRRWEPSPRDSTGWLTCESTGEILRGGVMPVPPLLGVQRAWWGPPR